MRDADFLSAALRPLRLCVGMVLISNHKRHGPQNRCVLSANGRKVTAALLAVSSADAQRLMEAVA